MKIKKLPTQTSSKFMCVNLCNFEGKCYFCVMLLFSLFTLNHLFESFFSRTLVLKFGLFVI